jgi:hypothetical protein
MHAWSSVIVSLSPVVLLALAIVGPAAFRALVTSPMMPRTSVPVIAPLLAMPDPTPEPQASVPAIAPLPIATSADLIAAPAAVAPIAPIATTAIVSVPTTPEAQIAKPKTIVLVTPTGDTMIDPGRGSVGSRRDRILLPMSSTVSVLPNVPTTISKKNKKPHYIRPERIIIGGAPVDWVVNDIKIGDQSQLSRPGDIPGEVFSPAALDDFVSFSVLAPDQDFSMVVTYIGAKPAGEQFLCTMLGSAQDIPTLAMPLAPASDLAPSSQTTVDPAIPSPTPTNFGTRRGILLMTSDVNVLPGLMARIVSRIQDVAFRAERIVIHGTPSDWVINDVRIGNQPQIQGDVPGEVFSSAAIDAGVSFATAIRGQEFSVIVTYVGGRPEGASFACSVPGVATTADLTMAGETVSTSEGAAIVAEDVAPRAYFLPLGTSAKILPNTSTQVTARSQVDGFRCERIVIDGTPADWIVNDIQIGGRSQLIQAGDLPGEMFAASAINASLSLEGAYVGMEFVMFVTYVGKNEAGASFDCVALGTASDVPRASRARMLLPMSSGVNILTNASARITSRPQTGDFRPDRIILGGVPSDWIIGEVKVGNSSQLAQAGDLPGGMFALGSTLPAYPLETILVGMDFSLLATYVGTNPDGAPFVCGVIGDMIDHV